MTIILTILKIIGKTILWIIALLIVLILVILFCPIFYEAKGEKYDKLSVEGKVKLLLGIISLRFRNSNEGETYAGVYVFGKKLGNNHKEKKVKGKKRKQKKEVDDDNNLVAAEMDNCEDNYNKPILKKTVESDLNEQESIVEEKNEGTNRYNEVWTSEEAAPDEPVVRKVKLADAEKILQEKKGAPKISVKRIKIPEEEKQKKEAEIKSDDGEKSKEENKNSQQKVNAEYFLKMPKAERKILLKAVIKLLKSLLRGVKPNKFYLIGTVGLSDPALTGEVVGTAWVLNGILNKRIEISAAFDREVIEGEVYIKGIIVPAYMLLCLIRFALVKPVRKIIKLLLKGSGDKNGKRNRKQS